MNILTFIEPNALLGLIIVPIMGVFLLWRELVRQQKLRELGDDFLIRQLILQVNFSKRLFKVAMWFLALISLILALARPTWGTENQPIQSQSVDFVFLIDVSRSMDAQDVVPSRLERLIIDIQAWLPLLSGNNIGVLIFTDQSLPYLPFTSDTEIITAFLESISTNSLTSKGTDIIGAVETAVDFFQPTGSQKPIFILFSDGESHSETISPNLQKIIESGIRIFTIGYGTIEGSPIPLYTIDGTLAGYHTDQNNNLVITRLESDLIEKIAQATQGQYAPYEEFSQLAETIVETMKKNNTASQTQTRPSEQFIWFVLLSFLFLSVDILMVETRS